MNLSFSTKWSTQMNALAGKPTHFVEKIWAGLLLNEELLNMPSNEALEYLYACEKNIHGWVEPVDFIEVPKLTTIREDIHDRWKAGNKIHFVINNRTKDRFQFAPVLRVKSVQKIEIFNYTNSSKSLIQYSALENDCTYRIYSVLIDGKQLRSEQVDRLAINDGFPSVEAFFNFFDKDFSGKIIHWTDLRY